MSLATSIIEPWPPNSPSHPSCGRNPSAALLKARWHDSSGPPPSQGWGETHPASDLNCNGSCDGWRNGHFSPGLKAVGRTAGARNNAGDKRREHRCNIRRIQRNRASEMDTRRHVKQQRQQEQAISHAALTMGPLQVSSVAVRPFAHGEIYRRPPPQRVSGWRPLMATATALSSSLAPLEPQGFDPRLLNKQALCVGSGVSRGASLTSQASALRQKQLQFRHRVYQGTHKSAGLARLLTVMREGDSSVTGTGGGRDSAVSRGGGRRRA